MNAREILAAMDDDLASSRFEFDLLEEIVRLRGNDPYGRAMLRRIERQLWRMEGQVALVHSYARRQRA